MAVDELIIRAADIEAMPGEQRVHFLNSNAVWNRRSLGDATGLSHIGVHLIRVEPGRDSTEYHIHYYEEECIYVLEGKGTLTLNEEDHPFGAGDFVGLPAGVAAHGLKNTGSGPLVCLVMGQRLDQDVADYPHKGKRLYRNSGEWNLVDLQAIEDPRGK